ncbi:MAG: hypothetical protein M3159_02685, partial [Actinomycetota bacterium]|nr:hypothetical protein [Actinomycetota bacterium]
MKRSLLLVLVGALFVTGAGVINNRASPARSHDPVASPSSAYAKLPLSFEPNVGQADAGARFVSRSGGYTLALSATR